MEIKQFWNKAVRDNEVVYISNSSKPHPEIHIRNNSVYRYYFEVNGEYHYFLTLFEAMLNANDYIKIEWRWIFVGKHHR